VNIFNDQGDYYAVYCFHKSVTLSAKPSSFYIHVSADNHYKLYINGNLVSVGPARGSWSAWNYETINIAKYLKAGANSIAAQVWNEAGFRPDWQNSVRTGFVIQGNTSAEEVMNTNNTWKCFTDNSIGVVWGYFVATNGEHVNMATAPPSNWNQTGFDDSAWPVAANLFAAQPKGGINVFGYLLVPSILPQRDLKTQNITNVRRTSGMTVTSPLTLPLTVPANTKAIILLDQGFETTTFPVIKFHGGTGAGLSLGYAETLYNHGTNFSQKGNRNTVIGQDFRGLTDTITSNGGTGQSFSPFNIRAYRYIQLIVQTSGSALVVDSLYGIYTAYPFKQNATFATADGTLQSIRDVGWRTARDCAYETYEDCPYYEQSQYIADTRVQAMISYYESGDDRLARNAINNMDQSRIPDGVTLSRYPSRTTQIISPFSLLSIGILYDFFMYRNDNTFVKSKLLGTRAVLNFFNQYQGSDGSLTKMPYWLYVDGPITSTYSGNWYLGAPPLGSDGCSAVIDMQLLAAYEQAAAMETAIGSTETATSYNSKISQLKTTIQSKYYNGTKQLYADTKEQNSYSEHANAMSILTNVVTDANKPAFAQRIVADSSSITRCNIYFKYYLNQALVKGGLGNNYTSWLNIWRQNISQGLTTWAEVADLVNNRSDCHAWGASPNVEFFRTILGIDSYAAGFSKVQVAPNLGTLTNVSGSIPHPNGTVSVSYILQTGNTWKIDISLPVNTTGTLIWNGTSHPLVAGENLFTI
jgi:alpha-L-rhamnosidase